MMKKKCQDGIFFFKHVVCGPLATDQGKCHILFKLLFSALFLNLHALAVHMYLAGCILRLEDLGFISLFSTESGNMVQAGKKAPCDSQQVTRLLWPQGANLATQGSWSKIHGFDSLGFSEESGIPRAFRITTHMKRSSIHSRISQIFL